MTKNFELLEVKKKLLKATEALNPKFGGKIKKHSTKKISAVSTSMKSFRKFHSKLLI